MARVFERFDTPSYSFQLANPYTLERRLFKHFWLVPTLPMALMVALTLVANGVGRDLPWPLNLSNINTSTWLVVAPAGVMGLVCVLLFQRFMSLTPRALVELEAAGRIRPRSDSYQFDDALEAALRSRWRLAMPTVFIPLVLVLLGLSRSFQEGLRVAADYDFAPKVWPALAWMVLVFLVMPSLMVYFGGQIAWAHIVVSRFITRLTTAFQLDVQPRHPDRAGGLKRIGDIAFQIATIYLVFAAYLSFVATTMRRHEVINELPILVYLGLVVAVFLVYLTFYGPMLAVHTAMTRVKAAYQDDAYRKIASTKHALAELIEHRESAEDSALIERLKDDLAQLRDIYFNKDEPTIPTWPFDTAILVRFLTPQLIPLLAFLANEDFLKWLKTLLEALGDT